MRLMYLLLIKEPNGVLRQVEATSDELEHVYETIKPIVRTLRSERRRRAINEAKAQAMQAVAN